MMTLINTPALPTSPSEEETKKVGGQITCPIIEWSEEILNLSEISLGRNVNVGI